MSSGSKSTCEENLKAETHFYFTSLSESRDIASAVMDLLSCAVFGGQRGPAGSRRLTALMASEFCRAWSSLY